MITRHLSIALVSILLLLVIVAPVAATVATFTVQKDGDVQEESNGDWPTIRNDVGDAVVNTRTDYLKTGLWGTSTKHTYDYNSRSGLVFNTSSIPDGATIHSAYIALYVASTSSTYGKTNLTIVDFSPSGTAAFIAGDYHNTSFTRHASDIPYDSVTSSAYNNLSLNALGLSNISKTGLSVFMAMHTFDADNTSFPGAFSASYSGYQIRPLGYSSGSVAPLLVVTYSLPPDSITGLTNSTPTCNRIDWSWTNPTNSDYGGLGILINGTWGNVSNGTTSKSLTGLPNNTVIMFNATSYNAFGVQNVTHWVNSSATTAEFCSSETWWQRIIHWWFHLPAPLFTFVN